MDGQLNNTEVICCFCGKPVLLGNAAILTVQPHIDEEESQKLFSHRNHFVSLIDKSIPLHPDLLDDPKE